MADTYTVEQLAKAFKEKYPQYDSVPDAQLASAILEKFPQYKANLAGAPPGLMSPPETPKALQPDPEKSLYEKVGGRVKSNLDPRAAGDYIGQLGEAILHPPYPHGGGLKATGEALKSTYSQPENVIGDLLSAYILNSAEGGPQPVKAAAKSTLQRLAGAGTEPVLLEAIAREKAIAKGQAEYASKVAEVNAQRAAAETQSKYGDQLRQNLQQTYEKVKGKLDSRWGQMRSTPTRSGGGLSILKDEVGNAKDLRDGMEIAEKKFLQGSPESLRQFRDLTGWIERERGAVEGEAGGVKPGLTPPTWDELRTHYSAMGDAMYGRDLPGNVYNALRYVREDVVGKQLQGMAEKAGVGEQYQTLLKDHSQFENDWNNTKSVTRGGGSPLAVARRAPNAATLIPQVTGKTGDLLIKRLAKYSDAGASPATAEAVRKAGTINVPSTPAPPKTPPPIDPVAIRRQRILNYTGRPEGLWDLIPPRVLAKPALSVDAIREWIAKFPRHESALPGSPMYAWERAMEKLGRRGKPAGAPASPPSRPGPATTESFTDMATRRGPGEPPAASGLAQQRTTVDNLRMLYDRQRASGDPGMWATASKLKDATDALRQAEMAQWGSAYAKGPQGGQPTGQGGGGANFDAAALEKMKADLQRRIDRGELK